MSSLEFREATQKDEANLLSLMYSLAKQDPEVVPFDESAARSAFHQFLALPSFGRIWLLYEGDTLVGYIILTIGFSFEFRGHDAFIDELYIVSTHRRRGYGSEAVAFVEKKAREMGVNAVHLEVDPGNDRAFGLYRRMGFVDHNRLLMTKWLRSDQ